MNKYILIGIPNCGKTTLGRRAAERLGMPFFDTDIMIKNRIGNVDFVDFGFLRFAERFNKEQREVVLELARKNDPAIIATGAEIALIPSCLYVLQQIGVIIHLKRDPDIILDGLEKRSKSFVITIAVNGGPPIKSDVGAVTEYAKELFHYEAAANLSLDNNGTEEEGLEKLIALIQVLAKTDAGQGIISPSAEL